MPEGSRGGLPDLGSTIDMIEEQQTKLADFQRKIAETTTVVDSRNKMLTVTLDGNGELRDLKFNTTGYRSMAAAELSAVILETLQKARGQSLETMQEVMDDAGVAGNVNVKDLTSEDADFSAVLGKVMEPSMELMREAGATSAKPSQQQPGEDDGWERR